MFYVGRPNCSALEIFAVYGFSSMDGALNSHLMLPCASSELLSWECGTMYPFLHDKTSADYVPLSANRHLPRQTSCHGHEDHGWHHTDGGHDSPAWFRSKLLLRAEKSKLLQVQLKIWTLTTLLSCPVLNHGILCLPKPVEKNLKNLEIYDILRWKTVICSKSAPWRVDFIMEVK